MATGSTSSYISCFLLRGLLVLSHDVLLHYIKAKKFRLILIPDMMMGLLARRQVNLGMGVQPILDGIVLLLKDQVCRF